MSVSDVMMLAVPPVIFACGAALLSYRFLRRLWGWPLGEFGLKSHLPGILGTALMLFAIFFASSLGWIHVIVAVLGGFTVSYLYVYVFRMWAGAALLGPALAVLAVLLMPA